MANDVERKGMNLVIPKKYLNSLQKELIYDFADAYYLALQEYPLPLLHTDWKINETKNLLYGYLIRNWDTFGIERYMEDFILDVLMINPKHVSFNVSEYSSDDWKDGKNLPTLRDWLESVKASEWLDKRVMAKEKLPDIYTEKFKVPLPLDKFLKSISKEEIIKNSKYLKPKWLKPDDRILLQAAMV